MNAKTRTGYEWRRGRALLSKHTRTFCKLPCKGKNSTLEGKIKIYKTRNSKRRAGEWVVTSDKQVTEGEGEKKDQASPKT